MAVFVVGNFDLIRASFLRIYQGKGVFACLVSFSRSWACSSLVLCFWTLSVTSNGAPAVGDDLRLGRFLRALQYSTKVEVLRKRRKMVAHARDLHDRNQRSTCLLTLALTLTLSPSPARTFCCAMSSSWLVVQSKALDVDGLYIVHVQCNRAPKQRRRTYRAHGRINREFTLPHTLPASST